MAIVKFEEGDKDKFELACEKLRYFTFPGETVQSRSLRFIKEIKQRDFEAMQKHNVFIRKLPKEMTHEGLDKLLS